MVVEDEEDEEGGEDDYCCCLLLPYRCRLTNTSTIATKVGEVIHIDSIDIMRVLR